MGTNKQLYILRHAKSGWDDPGRCDRDRALNIRGIKDIQLMGCTLREELNSVERIVSSHANRAIHTSILLATAANLPLGCIQITEKLYEAEESQALRLITKLPNDLSHVMIVGHNPTLSMLASTLVPDLLESLPTSALVRIQFKTNNWSEIDTSKVEWTAYDYPKKFKE